MCCSDSEAIDRALRASVSSTDAHIDVESPPHEEARGHNRQLKRAIDEAVKRLSSKEEILSKLGELPRRALPTLPPR